MKNDLYLRGNLEATLNDMVLDKATKTLILKFLREYQHLEVLRPYHLPLDTKLLFHGPSGCGKTMMAQVLAKELACGIMVVNLSTIVSSKLGDTAKNIATLFQKAAQQKSILFLDEFDSLGAMRDTGNTDSGEMRRVVNTLIQCMDYLHEDAILIAATNTVTMLDQALLRRFQLKVGFTMPDQQVLDSYYDKMLLKYPKNCRNIERRYELSYAEAKMFMIDQVKEILINEALEKTSNGTDDSE
ncbi:AAA family ATPase [Spongiimicrobium salis]|uniref:AAA family ATPase n=1 Tax=Spongiimicrobium salis TaxID=1667022 RepID=UPI00374DC06C